MWYAAVSQYRDAGVAEVRWHQPPRTKTARAQQSIVIYSYCDRFLKYESVRGLVRAASAEEQRGC
jgi:hypothetical protein